MSDGVKQTNGLARWIERHWYRSPLFNIWLLPLQGLFWLAVTLRRFFYALLPPLSSAVPVIVVGNISVGGTGKTPLIIWLANRAQEMNMRVGIVSRGYGGETDNYPLEVRQDTSASECGDEPKLLFERLGCPVVVDPQRKRAVDYLAGKVDLVLSDDGLQHYAMARVAELVVVDGERGFGNGWLLPIGPLREPETRLDSVDRVIVNGKDFVLQPLAMINAITAERMDLLTLANEEVHAVAGIGHPERFFNTLRQLGLTPLEHPFADHHPFTANDLAFDDNKPVVMTEKDWVKCRSFVTENCWYVPVDAVPDRSTRQALDTLLTTWGEKYHG
ncbi:tetraacyldisaccharide 4'-kinase [Oceanobacter sp. 5_MG-2023]|uniref:tetraacyldisaccharide 4'-kinase n=1 Tax=Oceanobacter sp. 5_MG-2023 TaxID=3062645 RepID=UPI0026E39CE9|nr:tetraacyldisaccharide 4'-kinase [Oceanobacter sp. 5_MG-2023]MDO6681177.1 tetraacyldisaccharide 4'-kinase [Oceanobacter sp. 5_MG-2023]